MDRRRLLLSLPLAALAGCGFAPVYAPGGAAEGLVGQIRATDPVDRAGFALVTRLEDRLGRPGQAPYELRYEITTSTSAIGVTPEGATLRYRLSGAVEYQLLDRASGTALTAGRVESFTAWSATGSVVAGLTAEEAAAERLMQILADMIATRLLASAAEWRA